jgi:hypothetical protein
MNGTRDSKLKTNDDLDERIRARAYELWKGEGQPHGLADRHWEIASELIAIEESQKDTLKPISSGPTGPTGEPVEPLLAVENAGEFPTLTDQGEEQTAPSAPKPRKRAAPKPTASKTPASKPTKT